MMLLTLLLACKEAPPTEPERPCGEPFSTECVIRDDGTCFDPVMQTDFNATLEFTRMNRNTILSGNLDGWPSFGCESYLIEWCHDQPGYFVFASWGHEFFSSRVHHGETGEQVAERIWPPRDGPCGHPDQTFGADTLVLTGAPAFDACSKQAYHWSDEVYEDCNPYDFHDPICDAEICIVDRTQ